MTITLLIIRFRETKTNANFLQSHAVPRSSLIKLNIAEVTEVSSHVVADGCLYHSMDYFSYMQNLLHNSGKFGLLLLLSLQVRIIFHFAMYLLHF